MHQFYSKLSKSLKIKTLALLLSLPISGAVIAQATFCTSNSNCGTASIINVSVTGDNGTTINNTSTCSGYSDFTNLRVNMSVGVPYTVDVDVTSAAVAGTILGNLYVDWNNDTVFDQDTEEYIGIFANGAFTFTVTPISAVNEPTGLRRMRIVTAASAGISNSDIGPEPCGARTDGGETEDYHILFVAPTDTVPACVDKATVMPKDSASNVCQKTTISWGAVTDADGYIFSLFNGSTAVVSKDTIRGATSYTPSTPLLSGVTYTWIAVPYAGSTAAIACDTLEFTVSPNPDPTTAMIPGHSYDICQGATINLDGNPNDGTSPYTHSWNGADNKLLSDTAISNPVFTASAAVGSYKYFYTVKDANNCTAKDSINISIIEKAVAGTIEVKPDVICAGEKTRLTIFGSKGTHSWETAADATGPWSSLTLTQINDTTFETGSLTIDTYFRNTAKLGVCTETGNPAKVTVNPLPAKPILNTYLDSVCQGDSVILVVTNYTTDVIWNNAGATYDDTLIVKASGNFVAKAIQNGCTNISDTAFIKVNANPAKPSITVTGSNPACDGDSIILKSSIAGNNTWSTTETTDQIKVTTSGTFTVTQTNASGCSTTSNSYTTVVNPLPAKPVITAQSAATFCTGGSVKLASSYVGGNKWSTGSTNDTIQVTTSADYIVTYTDGNGCKAFSDPFTVTVNPLPAKPTITSSTPLCQGTPAYLYSSSTGNNTWSDSAASTTDSIQVTTNGTYTVTVTDNNGCTATSNNFAVNFEALPAKPTITQTGNILTASAGGAKYQWYDVNGPIAGATNRSYSPTSSGFYYVAAISAKGCVSDTSAMKAFHGVGIDESLAVESVNVFPNPGNGHFTILVADAKAVNEFKLLDLSGRVLSIGNLAEGSNSVNLELAAGTYLLELINDHAVVGQRRIIVQ